MVETSLKLTINTGIFIFCFGANFRHFPVIFTIDLRREFWTFQTFMMKHLVKIVNGYFIKKLQMFDRVPNTSTFTKGLFKYVRTFIIKNLHT